jgi:hypothetical protein
MRGGYTNNEITKAPISSIMGYAPFFGFEKKGINSILDLMNEYNQAYDELFVNAQQKLSKKLGLIEEVTPDDVFTTFAQMNPDASVIEEIAAKSEEIAKIASPIKKQTAQQEFADEIGEDILERVNFINKNFDKIVEALAASKINVFFDENNQFKKCE